MSLQPLFVGLLLCSLIINVSVFLYSQDLTIKNDVMKIELEMSNVNNQLQLLINSITKEKDSISLPNVSDDRRKVTERDVKRYNVDAIFQAEYKRIDNEDPVKRCKRYGVPYTPGKQRKRLFMGALIADESWDLFRIHTTEVYGLYNVVSLVESNMTFSGSFRKMRFNNSIEYDLLVNSGMFGNQTDVYIDYHLDFDRWSKVDHWTNPESLQRNLILKSWIKAGIK